MKKMWKRFVSLLLACTLLAGMLPLSASAAEKPGEGSNQYQYAKGILDQLNNELGYGDSKFLLSPAAPLGGDSDLFTYVISRFYIDPVTNEGTTDMRYVIVPGVGASDTTMPNYSSAKDGQPWAKAAVSTFYIAKGVTGIGSYAFASQPSLNNVVFQDASDLTYIGQRAFYDDDNAVFTDEGNEDKTTTLDLSNVKKMGEYAFYNCDKLTGVELGGSITAVETVEGEVKETEYKIPSHAFTSTGVQSITVPSGIKKVGEYAFYDCPLNKEPYISLQEGLETIGNYAFGKNDAAPNTAMSSLTIPSSVESIGDHAFYNYKGLQTVTVLGKDNGGAKESVLDHVGDAAFGDADHNAYSTTTTIQDAVHPEIEYTGLVGTQFYLPKELEKNDNLFVNGETCYTGNISPLTFELTVPATCTTDGYNQYYQTAQNTSVGGEPLTLHVRVKIPALGHDWDKGNPVNVPATCTNDAYTYEVCKNDKTHHRTTGVVNGSALGHSYEVTDVDQPAINADNATATIVTYTCENYNVVPEENKHDGQEPAQYQWTIPATTLEATTTDSLADIASQLPKPQGSHAASLEWAEDDTFSDLEEGEKSYHVRLKVNHATFAGYSDDDFTIRVKVSKAKLDFSDVRFVNADRWIDVENEDFDVEGLPEGVNQEPLKIEYKLKSAGDEVWSENKPSDGEEAKYVVRVTFTYDNTKYQLVTDEKELLPPSEYTLDEGTEANTGTIIGDYTIAQLNMDNIVVETPSLTFNGTSQNPEGTPQNTIRLNGVPEHSKVTFSWGDSGEQVIDDTGTNPLVSGAAITDAGTYTIHVKIEKETYKDFERDVRVTIAPQTLTTPTATTSPTYEPGETRTGVPYDNDDRYTMEGNTGINAGDYTAKAQVYNANNYVWSTGDTNQDGTVEIPWKILYKLLPKPTIQTAMGTVTYDGEEETPVSVGASSGLAVSYEGDVLQAKYKDELAYTATNAKETDANDYTVTVQLKNKNYKWSDQTDGDITLSWKIEPKQIKAPTVTVANKVYDGKLYNTDGAEITNLVHSDDSAYILELGADHTYYEGHAKLESAPTNAGNYAVEVDFDFVEGQKETNYQIVQNARQPFTITPAEATMEFSQKEVSAPYTAEGTTLQQVKVTNLVTVDVDKPASDVYTVTYTYKYRADDESEWENEEHKIINPDAFVFMDVGQYQITAKWGAGTVSNNYTAKDAIYTLTIKKAEDQSITLTPDKPKRWTAAEGQTPAKYTITYGEAATFTVIGKAALDNASISYAVNGDSNVVSVDGRSGVVTIHKAGTATITVTAADTANVAGTSVDYTVTVEKATPTLGLNAGTAAYTGSEVAEDTYKKATLSGAGEGYAQPDKEKLEYYFYTYDEDGKETILADKENENALKTIPSSVGDYWLKVVFPGDACYSDAAAVAKFTITPAELSVLATGHTGTYDGTEYPAIKVNSVTGNDTQLAEGNYTVKYAKTTEEEAPAATAENVWKDTLSVKDVADSSSGSLYYWYMVQDTAGNYEPKIEQVNVSITPAALKLNNVPDSYSKTYDGDNDVETDLNDITVTGIATEPISVTATGTYDNENADKDKTVTLTLTLSGTDGANIDWGNYSYNDQALTEGQITLTKTGAGTITPKAITVTGISAVERVYDGTKVVQLTGEPETTDKVGEDDLTLTLANDATGSIVDANVGKGKDVTVETSVITLGGTDKNNYTVKEVKYDATTGLTVNIDQRPVNLEFAGIGQDDRTIEKPYTGQPVSVTVGPVTNPDEGTGFVDSDQLKADDVDYTYTPVDPTTDKNHTAVGSYTVTAALKGTSTGNYGNYELKFPAEATLKITPAEMVVIAEDYTGTYTGKAHNVTASWTAKTTAGDQPITITGVQFIKKDEQHNTKPEADAEGWAAISFFDVAQSGKYWYKVTAENYAPIVGDSAVTITINPATLTLSSSLTKEKGYDGTTVAVVTGQKVTGAQNGENITVPSVSAAYDNANVGTGKTITTTYKVTFGAGVTPGNYTYTGNVEGKATSTWTIKTTVSDGKITQAPVTVTISDQTSVYDGKEPTVGQEEGTEDEPKAWYVSTGEVFSQDTTKDNLGIALSIASGSKDAGTYAITGTANNSNYDVTFTGSWTGGTAGTYTITHRPISVQIGNAEGFYGDAPVLKGIELTYEGTDEENHRGLAPDENSVPNITLGTGASAQSPVAGYVIYAVDGNNDRIQKDTPVVIGNYNVTFTNEGTYTVNPRPITITIKDHSSKYGAEINGGIADPLSDKDYTVAITAGNTVTGGAIVNGDDLGITLFTTAKKGDNAGTYPISGEAKAESSVVSNYAITWKGENPFIGEGEPDSTKATYTVEKAELTVKAKQTAVYAQYGQETANPLTFTNASTGEEITVDDSNYETLENAVTYTLNPADSLTMETENKAEGKFTVNVTDTTVTVEVNVAETDNFKAATKITYDVYTSASGSLTVDLPFADLTYTSEEQKLLTGAPTLPGGVVIRYKLGEKGAWTEYSDADPSNWQTLVGTGAGDYTVYWETKAGGNYNASSGHETTEIKKANLSATYTGLNGSEVTLVLSEMGDTYTIPLDLTGNKGYTHSNGDGVTFLSGNTDVAIAKNSTATLELRGVAGEAKITINCPGDNNYNPGTFTFTVTVTDQKAEILYDVTGTTRDYNGQPQTIAVKVTAPASGATVMYWNEKTSAYDLSEPPAYTDVQDDGYTIKFRITAPGYNTVTDKATLKIEPKPITENMIAGIAESYTYTGSKITFDDAISVHDEGVLLTKSKDYTISYDDNTAVGTGTVTITGTGNYKGSVKKNFTISPVDASDLTASLDRTFGYYGDSNTNNATVTVTHGRHTVDSSEIELTVIRQDSTIESGDVVQEGLKLTFNKAGIYTIHVEVSGTHKGEFDLTYTLLPQDVASDDFQVTTNPVDRVWTYDGENRAFGVTVTSGGASLQKGVDFTLRYTYLPYVGNPTDDVYDLGTTVFTEAGIYTVIVEGTGNYTGHAELVALIQPRDLSDADITAAFAQTGLVYNGEAQEPDVTLTYNGTPINQLKNTEYYGNTNAGEAQALSAASEDCNNFTGARVDAFIIEKKSLNDSTITAKADPEKYYYTGYPVTPAVTVTDSGRNADLSIGADYTVSSDAVGPGKVTATVTGTGNYKDKVTVEFTILPTGAEPVETLNLTVTPSEWTWDNGQTKAAISVTFNGKELNDTDYQLTVSKDGETPQTVTKERAVELLSAPGEYTITATGMDAYAGSTDTETVTIQKIQPTVTVTATPNSLSGGGKVTLTLKGEKLPNGTDLKTLLSVTAKNDNDVTLEDLHIQWPEDGSLTAELTLPNTNETYTFALSFAGNDCYESASSNAMVVVGQQTSGGGGGSDPGDQPADPDDTGVSDWLNTKDHLAYLAGYPGGTFGPDQNMTRAEAAQMFYNLLLEKDVEITVEFEDVPADAWYAKPVNTLASLGILSGVGNGRFDPERSITRAEFTVIAMKFANTSGGGVNIFSDVNEDDWFYSAVVDSTQYGWINGYPDGTFRPEATISRAEVTVIVNHMLGRAADRPYVIAHEEELNTFGDVNRGHWGYFHIAEATNAHEYHTEDGTESWTGLS